MATVRDAETVQVARVLLDGMIAREEVVVWVREILDDPVPQDLGVGSLLGQVDGRLGHGLTVRAGTDVDTPRAMGKAGGVRWGSYLPGLLRCPSGRRIHQNQGGPSDRGGG